MITSVNYNKNREAFFAELNDGADLLELIQKYTKESFKQKIKNKIKSAVKKLIR